MKKKIVWNILGNCIFYFGVVEALLFAVYCSCSKAFPSLSLSVPIFKYYGIVALGFFVFLCVYFGLCILVCLKRYNSLCKNENISDEQLLGYYKAADKYYKYRIGEKYVFIDTPYGFICMTVDDIIDYSAYEKRNIKNMETVYDYETVYITQESECYTYHFVLKTKFGTFKNTLSNHASMMKLNNFFEEKITRAS